MNKSSLQVRAENASQKFKQKARRPIVIEFAGVPKAGKTTTLNTIHSFLKRCGFRVETVIERASVCPIRDKKHFNFNVWTACTSLAQILEKTQEKTRDQQSDSDPEILILDRRVFIDFRLARANGRRDCDDNLPQRRYGQRRRVFACAGQGLDHERAGDSANARQYKLLYGAVS
jgi:hypothetical protein